jgi:ubiquinone/menaquinone biosynthesis C-methylase UbiE
MEYTDYVAIKARIVPRLRYNQEIYEEAVKEHVSERTAWLDAGCGSQIVQWRELADRILVRRARLVVGCDADRASIRKHRTLSRLVIADLKALPFRSESFSLVTTNMVVEHLDRPFAAFAEFARVLKRGGRVIVHTPNVWSPFVVASRLLPESVKLKLAKALDGRLEDDVFPTRYRANSPRRLRALMRQAGLKEEWCRLLASEAVFASTHPVLVAPELLYIKLTLWRALRFLRPTVLASFVKPDGLRRATD